jgi:hypothetical protein
MSSMRTVRGIFRGGDGRVVMLVEGATAVPKAACALGVANRSGNRHHPAQD